MGIGIGGFRSNMRTITLKRADGTVVGTINRSCGKDKKKMSIVSAQHQHSISFNQ